MNLREEVLKLKIKKLLAKEAQYDFPKFMRFIRKTYSITRKEVAETMGVSESKIYYMEAGNFKKSLDAHFLDTLANYYAIDKVLLWRKHNLYLQKKKPKADTQNCKVVKLA